MFEECFENQVTYGVTIDGARQAHFVPCGTVWAGEVWWWVFTRAVGKG